MTLGAHPGCWNSPRQDYLLVKNRQIVRDDPYLGLVVQQGLRRIEDTSSRECRFDGRAQDPRCQGCLK